MTGELGGTHAFSSWRKVVNEAVGQLALGELGQGVNSEPVENDFYAGRLVLLIPIM